MEGERALEGQKITGRRGSEGKHDETRPAGRDANRNISIKNMK